MVELNHTIVAARDRRASAAFLTEVLGLAAREPFGPFMVVEVANGVSLDLADTDGDITAQHRAFLVSESEFDHIFGRVQARGLPYWADPARRRRGEINHNDGGPCRLYFLRRTGADPAGAPRACGRERPFRGRMSVTSSCLLTGRQKRFPKTTRRYDRSRHALTRHGTYAIAHYLAGRHVDPRSCGPRSVAPSALSQLDSSKSQLAELAGAQPTRTSSPFWAPQRRQ